MLPRGHLAEFWSFAFFPCRCPSFYGAVILFFSDCSFLHEEAADQWDVDRLISPGRPGPAGLEGFLSFLSFFFTLFIATCSVARTRAFYLLTSCSTRYPGRNFIYLMTTKTPSHFFFSFLFELTFFHDDFSFPCLFFLLIYLLGRCYRVSWYVPVPSNFSSYKHLCFYYLAISLHGIGWEERGHLGFRFLFFSAAHQLSPWTDRMRAFFPWLGSQGSFFAFFFDDCSLLSYPFRLHAGAVCFFSLRWTGLG